MDDTAHLEISKPHLEDSESMKTKFLWSDQPNLLGRAPSTVKSCEH